MDLVDLDELERLLAAATPGDWIELSRVGVACQNDTGEVHGLWSHEVRRPAQLARSQRVLLAYPGSPREWDDIRLVQALRNAAPALIAAARRERELRAALAFYADPQNYILTGAPSATGELSDWAPHVLGDDGERARAAL